MYSWHSLYRKARVEDVKPEHGGGSSDGVGLKKCLTAVDLIAYGVGSTVGAGIFVTIGEVAKDFAGPAILFSFLSAAVTCLISAFCYAEFAARIPVSGSAYSFSYVALGEFIGWFIGWNLTLEYSISASAVARGWGGYIAGFFKVVGVHLPDWLINYPLPEHIFGSHLHSWIAFSPLSVVIIVICFFILIMGVKDSAKFNLVITILNVTTITFIIIFGAFLVDTSNWKPFFPYGGQGVFKGAGIVFFSYIGFDSVTTLAGEVARPSRDLPLGIVGTLSIATVLYIGVSLVATGMINYTQFVTDAPLINAFEVKGYVWAAIIVAIGGVTALVASTLCSLMGQPRIYYQMSIDGLLPGRFGRVNPKTQVPEFGTIVTATSAAVLALCLELSTLTNMISIGTLLAFTVVCAGIVVLRCQDPTGAPVAHHSSWTRFFNVPIVLLLFFLDAVLVSILIKNHMPWWSSLISAAPMLILAVILFFLPQPNRPTTFNCPLVPFIPLIGIFVNTFLIVQLNVESIYRVIGWTAIGMVIYFGYGIRHSKLNYEKVNSQSDSGSYLNAPPGSYKYIKVEDQ